MVVVGWLGWSELRCVDAVLRVGGWVMVWRIREGAGQGAGSESVGPAESFDGRRPSRPSSSTLLLPFARRGRPLLLSTTERLMSVRAATVVKQQGDMLADADVAPGRRELEGRPTGASGAHARSNSSLRARRLP
jgi:hypothetical protein